MRRSYAMSHSGAMPYRIICPRIVTPVKPYLLVKALVDHAGGALPVATAMGAKSFQGTLWKICDGRVVSPSRSSAERIAKHFNLPVEAIYSDKLAAAEWHKAFGAAWPEMAAGHAPAPSDATPQPSYTPAARELAEAFDALPEDTLEAIEAKARLHQWLLYSIGLLAGGQRPTAPEQAPAAQTIVAPSQRRETLL